jgi:serine/threonine protein kinase
MRREIALENTAETVANRGAYARTQPPPMLQLTIPARLESHPRVPDPAVPSSDSELLAQVERALGDRYELDCEIGRGGMGIVYRAKDRRLKRTVAIKVLPPELAFRSEIKTRFLREAETAAQLNHANIVDIYSVDEAESLVYFVMAYIKGDNLAQRVHQRGPMGIEESCKIVRDVADALAYAHERGVIHRDIKPDNILLDADTGRPMVTDFGIARAVTEGDSRLTATGIAIGTPTYMSPEQAAGDRQIDGRSDLYSLGVVAYQMLAGQPPFMANSTPAILVKHISERPVPIDQRRRDVSPELARVVMTMLEKDPDARFPSAGAVVAALEAGGRGEDGGGTSEWGLRRSSGGSSYPMAAQPSYVAAPPSSHLPPPASFHPSGDDIGRWESQPVRGFRKKMGPYIAINAVILVAATFTGVNLVTFTVFYSVYMAYQYAKLWSAGYDWRDVFHQPRERELIDVVEDTATHLRAMMNSDERARMREERRSRALARRTGAHALPSGAPGHEPSVIRAGGPYGEWIRRAFSDRDEILRIIDRMSPSDRARVPDIPRSAAALAEKVQALALSLVDLERIHPPMASATLEAEIAQLERDANPLDRVRSEERVRRLAQLKRQRRGLAEMEDRRRDMAAKLDTCGSALESMKFDLLRLSTGSENHHHITSLAMEALSLARSVDNALLAVEEAGRLTSSRPSPRPTAPPSSPG